MPLIPPEETEFHRLSYTDENIRLFWWRGGLYRGIGQCDAAFYRSLVESAFFRDLMKEGLVIGTEIADLAHPDFALILKHDVVPVVSYPYEWTFDALKDAALLALALQERLAREGLYLSDPHPWNILFDGTRPVFVDIGAIGPMRSAYWPLSDSIAQYYRNPLRLMAGGHARIAHALMRAADAQGVLDREVYDILGGHGEERLRGRLFSLLRANLPLRLRQRVRNRLSPVISPFARLEAAREQILPLEFPGPDAQPPAGGRDVEAILAQLRPKSVLDIGCGHTRWAARPGARVVAIDTSDANANALYRRARKTALNIQPLVMDVTAPSGGDGVQARLYAPAAGRLKSECVMALGILHHIAIPGWLKFDPVVQLLSDFCERRLLVDFVPENDPEVEAYRQRRGDPAAHWARYFGWYNLENFKKALAARFSSVTAVSSDSPRPLFLCEK